MLNILLVVVVLSLWIYAFIDCLTTPDERVRNLPKVIWIIVILIFGGTLLLGPVAWLVAGRPRAGAVDHRRGEDGEPRPRTEPRRFVAPDDNPAFLASLNKTGGQDSTSESRERSDEDRLREMEEDLRRQDDRDGQQENGSEPGGDPDDRKRD